MKTLTPTLIAMTASCMMATAEWQPLWPGEAPGGTKPVVLKESEGEGGRLTDIEVPQYEVYLPPAERRSGAAVVILPGGGYTILAASHEGRDYATWLNGQGIVAGGYNPLADAIDGATNRAQVRQIAEVVARAAPTLPMHDAALAAILAAA